MKALAKDMEVLGLSLSFCVKDIVKGSPPIDRVHHIVSACCPTTESEVESIINQYCESYWKGIEALAREVVNQLRLEHKIQWCSMFDRNPICGTTNWVPYINCKEFATNPEVNRFGEFFELQHFKPDDLDLEKVDDEYLSRCDTEDPDWTTLRTYTSMAEANVNRRMLLDVGIKARVVRRIYIHQIV